MILLWTTYSSFLYGRLKGNGRSITKLLWSKTINKLLCLDVRGTSKTKHNSSKCMGSKQPEYYTDNKKHRHYKSDDVRLYLKIDLITRGRC